MFFKNTFLLILLLSLFACSSIPKKEAWPNDIPSIDSLTDYYNQDKKNATKQSLPDYLAWVKRFYFGSYLYSRGWKQATAEAVATIEGADKKKELEKNMFAVGDLVGQEWAKNRSHRFINSSNIITWGNALMASYKDKRQFEVVDLIYKDVQAMYAGQLVIADIKPERYSQDEFANADEELFLEE